MFSMAGSFSVLGLCALPESSRFYEAVVILSGFANEEHERHRIELIYKHAKGNSFKETNKIGETALDQPMERGVEGKRF